MTEPIDIPQTPEEWARKLEKAGESPEGVQAFNSSIDAYFSDIRKRGLTREMNPVIVGPTKIHGKKLNGIFLQNVDVSAVTFDNTDLSGAEFYGAKVDIDTINRAKGVVAIDILKFCKKHNLDQVTTADMHRMFGDPIVIDTVANSRFIEYSTAMLSQIHSTNIIDDDKGEYDHALSGVSGICNRTGSDVTSNIEKNRIIAYADILLEMEAIHLMTEKNKADKTQFQECNDPTLLDSNNRYAYLLASSIMGDKFGINKPESIVAMTKKIAEGTLTMDYLKAMNPHEPDNRAASAQNACVDRLQANLSESQKGRKN